MVVFDKTGTVTYGRPCVSEAHVFDDHVTLAQLCACVGAAESTSEHPLARALLQFCAQNLTPGEPAARSWIRGSAGGPCASGSGPGSTPVPMSSNAGMQAATAGCFPHAYKVQVAPGLGISCSVQLPGVRGGAAASCSAPVPGRAVSSTGGSSSSSSVSRQDVPTASRGLTSFSTGGVSTSLPPSTTSATAGLQPSQEVCVAVGNRAMLYHEGIQLGEEVEEVREKVLPAFLSAFLPGCLPDFLPDFPLKFLPYSLCLC